MARYRTRRRWSTKSRRRRNPAHSYKTRRRWSTKARPNRSANGRKGARSPKQRSWNALQKKVAGLGVNIRGKSRASLQRIWDTRGTGASRRKSKGRKKSTRSRRKYKWGAAPRLREAQTQLRAARKRLTALNKEVSSARRSLKSRPQRRRKARKNPGLATVGTYLGATVGGFTLSNVASSLTSMVAPGRPIISEYVVPGGLAAGVLWASMRKTTKKKMISPEVGYGLVAGIAGAMLARNVGVIGNVPGIRHMLGWLSFGQPVPAFGAFYAGAAGMGRYLRTEPGVDGMGRYLASEDFDGLGRYVTTPISESGDWNGLGALGAVDDDDDLSDEIQAASKLTVAEAEAENVNPRLQVVRATPSSAASMSDAKVGQILGSSRQVPGTYLVAITVAGRNVDFGTGPRPVGDDYPAADMEYGPKPIGPAQNISVSPYGVFSRGVFSSTLPTHGGISV